MEPPFQLGLSPEHAGKAAVRAFFEHRHGFVRVRAAGDDQRPIRRHAAHNDWLAARQDLGAKLLRRLAFAWRHVGRPSVGEIGNPKLSVT